MSSLRRAVFRVRGAYHLAAAVWSGSDWASAAGPQHRTREEEDAERRPERIIGVVEQFRRERVAGWVTVEIGHAPVTITLHVGKVPVAQTVARLDEQAPHRNGWDEVRYFELPLADIWQFVRPSTRLSVRADGRALPIAGRGMFRRGARDGTEDPQDLTAALRAGGSFDEDGHFRRSGT